MKGPSYSANGAAGAARQLRHDEPQVEPPAHPFRRGLSAPARRRQPDRADSRRREGQPVRHRRARRRRRHRPLRTHRRRAGRRPAVDTDPFIVTERDGKLYGRGTADMKGFLACVLAAVPDFTQRQLAVPIHLAFSYDEEIGCLGVRPMIAEFGSRLVKPRMVLVGEPTSMSVVDCPQRPGALARRDQGPRRAFEHGAARRQRHRRRRQAAARAGRHRARVEAAPAGSALRSALRHVAGDAHRRRHGDQHRAGVVPHGLRRARHSRRRHRRHRPAHPRLRRQRVPAGNAQGGAGGVDRYRHRQSGAAVLGRLEL